MNRLTHEKSPYLLQHAENPVDWYPWGDEAFRKAERENKPVFLSVGYSTCHWCHVMAHESFEDTETAEILNRDFVAVKVDREERPDIDSIYMSVCQMLTGAGGWPLSVFLDKEKRPFFAGTYFPKTEMRGMISFKRLLQNISELWKTDRKGIDGSAAEITAILKAPKKTKYKAIDKSLPEKALGILSADFDGEYGGFGYAPKFPTPHTYLFLTEYGGTEADEMAEKSLESIYRGGIFDHLGGGFSRYSTDNFWLVPHFEKMLYDNALLALSFARAYEKYKKEFYKRAAEETLDFLVREMSSKDGGFYSAFDADSEGAEGKFYVWEKSELEEIAGARFCKFFGATEEGNFEGENILNRIGAESLEIPPDIAAARKLAYKAREKRIKPHLDKKISAAWNGMAIAAFAAAGKIFGRKEYTERAKKALEFVEKKMIKKGALYSPFIDGQTKQSAFCDDYAYIIFGALALFGATGEQKYLKSALKFQREFDAEFWDSASAGYFLYGHSGEQLPARPKEITDNAYPSANSVAAHNLLRLAEFTGDGSYRKKAEEILDYFSERIENYPASHMFSVLSVFRLRENEPQKFFCDINGNCGPRADL